MKMSCLSASARCRKYLGGLGIYYENLRDYGTVVYLEPCKMLSINSRDVYRPAHNTILSGCFKLLFGGGVF